MSNFTVAGNGLKKMFLGEIVALIGVVVTMIPILGIVGSIATIAGAVLILVGLYSARDAHINYQYAFYMAIAGIVMNILGMIFTEGFLNGLVSVGSTAVSFFQLYFICTASSELLNAKGDGYQADRATLIWKINAVCALVSIAAVLVSVIPVINVIAGIAVIVAGIAEIVAAVLYLIFLYKGSQSLLS